MNPISGMKLGVLLVLLAAVLMITGCTQPSGEVTPPPTTTPAPTETISPAIETQKAELAALAASFASEIDGEMLATAGDEGPNSTAYETVLNQLKAFHATDSRLAYVYILQQQDGTARFIMVSGYDLPSSEIFETEYEDGPAELEAPVTEPIGVGPYTDPFGAFISGFAPLDISTEETVYLLGVDMNV
jgi:hypothetical protein